MCKVCNARTNSIVSGEKRLQRCDVSESLHLSGVSDRWPHGVPADVFVHPSRSEVHVAVHEGGVGGLRTVALKHRLQWSLVDSRPPR